MRRNTLPRRDRVLAVLREHFGLQQWELASLLRVSDAYYRLLEAEKRPLTPTLRGLTQLIALDNARVAANASAPPLPPALDLPTGRNPVQLRLRVCLYTAWRLREEAAPYARLARAAAHWQAALPGLRAHAAFADPPAQDWLTLCVKTISPAQLTAWRLLEARATGQQAEAAALALLPEAAAPTE